MSSSDDFDPNRAPAETFRQAHSHRRITTLLGAFLFLLTAAVIVWQNSRLAILWDLSYVLENAFRISLGQVPYRDFPFPYAPLTFLIQAAIIKVAGRVFWHTTVYCAIVGGAATVVTWQIIGDVFRDKVARWRLLAFILSLPLVVLGIYCVFPHPFYDSDCTLAVLVAVLLLRRSDRNRSAFVSPVLAGIALVIPLFIKQNVGIAFLLTALIGIAVLAIVEKLRDQSIRRHVITLTAAVVALGVALLLIHFTAGFQNYLRWTIQFAAERRTPARHEMLAIYTSKAALFSLLIFGTGVGLSCLVHKRSVRWLSWLAGAVMAGPFIWPVIYLAIDHDSSERADRLLNVWPLVLIVSFALAIITVRKRRGADLVLPFVLIATVNGAFMSQQLWGSTYAIWPLLIILLADVLNSVGLLLSSRLEPALLRTSGRPTILKFEWMIGLNVFAIVAAISLLISGGAYVYSHERLDYANLDEGVLTKSSLSALRGMTTRGPWLPDFEELVRYTDANIPRSEPILIIPGEDLFYYTTGRRPIFPVLLFDQTVNPYSPEQILNLAREQNIRWVIVKQDLQDEDEALEKERDELTEAIESEFEKTATLKNYDIYRRNEDTDDDEPRALLQPRTEKRILLTQTGSSLEAGIIGPHRLCPKSVSRLIQPVAEWSQYRER